MFSKTKAAGLHRALDMALAVAAVALVGAVLFALSAHQAGAYHPHYNPPIHTTTQHFTSAYEEFCVWVVDGSMAHTDALNSIRNILYIINQSEDWDLLAYEPSVSFWRVYWIALTNDPCYPNQYGAYFDVQYRIRSDSWVPYVGSWCGNANCVGGYNPTWNPAFGHYDYSLMIVFMRTLYVNNLHAVNHETGHVLGLMDGGPLSGTYDTTCSQSIMHSVAYGCPINYAWPQFNDRFNVEYISTYPWP